MEDRFHPDEKGIYRMCSTGILVCICLFAAGRFLGVDRVSAVHVTAAAAVLALLAGMNFLKTKGRILSMMTAAVCLGISVAAAGIQVSFTFLQTYFQWLMGSEVLQKEWITGYELMQVMIITVLCFLVQFLMEKYSLIRNGAVCLFLAGLIACLLTQTALPHTGVAFLLCYIVMGYTEWIQERWKKVRSRSIKAHMLWIMPFIILYFLIMILMPAPEKPYEWDWLKSAGNYIKESFITFTQHIARGGREELDISLSGFSTDEELKEGIVKDEREVIVLQSRTGLDTNVYLTGKVYDSFNGRQWQQEYHAQSEERLLDTIETLYAVKRFNREYTTDYLREAKLNINYRYFNTGYILAPLKTWKIEKNNKDMSHFCNGGNLLFGEQKGYGTEYEVTFYQMNVGQEAFEQLITNVDGTAGMTFDEILKECGMLTGEKLTVEDFKEHRQEIYDNYVSDIELSEEVKEYLSEITGDAAGLDKLKAIEKELSSYHYTKAPGKVPEKVTDESEFLDYFLLESRQGYCSHFATAFTLLARAEGFPARYVQGFCVPMQGKKEITVTSDMAHTWPEVYLDGIGWVPFEPTPGYAKVRYASWKPYQQSAAGAVNVGQSEPEWSENQEEESEKDAIEFDEEPVIRQKGTDFLKWAGYAALMILIGSAAIGTGDHLLHRYRYRKMSPEEKFQTEIFRNLRILSFLGVKREKEETLQELKERAELLEVSLKCIEDYEEMLYGGKQIQEGMLKEAKQEGSQLLELLKRKKKKTYFYFWLKLHL